MMRGGASSVIAVCLLMTGGRFLVFEKCSAQAATPDIETVLESAIYGVNAVVDIRRHCVVRGDGQLGVRVGAMMSLHSGYSAAPVDRCHTLSGWNAVQQSEAYFYMLDLAGLLQSDSFGSVELYALAVDTCSSSVLAVNEAQAIAVEGVLFRQRTFYALQNVTTDEECISRTNYTLFLRALLLGLVGPMTSSDTNAVSSLLSAYELLHVSHWATSTLFDQVDMYPYLFRSVPSDRFQAAAIADVVESLGWQYVSLIAGEDDVYSGRGFELLRSEARARGTFCFSMAERFSIQSQAGLERLEDTMRMLKQDTRSRVVILFCSETQAERFLRTAGDVNLTGKIVIGSEDWVNRISFTKDSFQSRVPVLGLAPRVTSSSLVEDAVRNLSRLLHDPRYLTVASRRNPWLKMYIENELNCSMLNPTGTSPCPNLNTGATQHPRPCQLVDFARLQLPQTLSIAESVILGMLALGSLPSRFSAAFTRPRQGMMFPSFPSVTELRQSLHDLRMPCNDYTALCRVFDDTQSAVPAYYIMNVQRTASNTNGQLVGIGSWNMSSKVQWNFGQTLDLKEFGSFNLSLLQNASQLNLQSQFPRSVCSDDCLPGQYQVPGESVLSGRCCWTCLNCSGPTYSNTTNAIACSVCSQGFHSNLTECLALEVSEVKYDSPEYIVILVFAVVGFALVFLTLLYYHMHRNAPLVKASDLNLSTIALGAMLVGHASAPFVIIVGPVTKAACLAHIVLPEPIKVAVTACLLVKTQRMNTIFRQMTVIRNRKLKSILLGTPMQVLLIASLVIIDVILVIVSVVTETVKVNAEYTSSSIINTCELNTTMAGVLSAYLCFLLLACFLLAFLTRKLPDDHNQSHLLYVASLTAFVVWLGLAPAYFITGKQLRPFIAAVFLEALLWAVWACLYLPRALLMLRQPQLRTSQRSQSIASRSMPDGSTTSSSNAAKLTSTFKQPSPVPSSSVAGMYIDDRRGSEASVGLTVSSDWPVKAAVPSNLVAKHGDSFTEEDIKLHN